MKILMLSSRMFSTAPVLLQLPHHPLYLSVNWNQVDTGHYAVVDPMDPHAILYFSEKEYKVMLRIALSNDQPLSVLARPGDKKVTPSDNAASVKNNSPPPGGGRSSPTEDLSGASSASGFPKTRDPMTPPTKSSGFWSIFRNHFNSDIDQSTQMLRPTLKNLTQVVNLWLRTLYGWSGGKLSSTGFYDDASVAAKYLYKILLNEGAANLCKRMHVSFIALSLFLAGSRINDTRHLGVAIKMCNGLPKWLPLRARSAIRAGDVTAIRIWMSLVRMYKGFQAPHPPVSLKTIISTPFESTQFDLRFGTFVRTAFVPWIQSQGWVPTFEGDTQEVYMSVKAGPNHSKSILGAGLDALAWMTLGDSNLRNYCLVTGHARVLRYYEYICAIVRASDLAPKDELFLGRLSVKEEAAGKNRIFALGDYFSQFALKPLHDWIFSILKHLPGDGTMDQDKALKGMMGYTRYWCYDISAATDTIPRILYQRILSALLGPKIADAWIKLLVDRTFVLLEPGKDRIVDQRVRYGRGQPMGFLSSWGMLALAHHALVQFAAWRVHCFPFFAYSITGDDSVIADNDRVANEYLIVMRELEIPISIPKSIVSASGFMQYISRSVRQRTDLSPASFKEELSVRGAADRMAFAARLALRGWVDFTRSDWLVSLSRLALAFNENVYYSYVLGPKGQMGWKIDVAVSTFLGPGSPMWRTKFQEPTLVSFLLHWCGIGDALSRGSLKQQTIRLPNNADFVKAVRRLLPAVWRFFLAHIERTITDLETSVKDFEEMLLGDYCGPQKHIDRYSLPLFLDWLDYYKTVIDDYIISLRELPFKHGKQAMLLPGVPRPDVSAAFKLPERMERILSILEDRFDQNDCSTFEAQARMAVFRIIKVLTTMANLRPSPKISDFDPARPPIPDAFTRGYRDWVKVAIDCGFLKPMSVEYGRMSISTFAKLSRPFVPTKEQIEDRVIRIFMSGKGEPSLVHPRRLQKKTLKVSGEITS